ncbi:hypothetical protein E8E11_009121 [Didymella keratinophila]|nr:hypothetical protein E8E11_009121 [Didymella keratinophila]
MARLSQAPDPLYTTPLSGRNPKPVDADQPNMPSPVPLRPLSLDTSLQSHGNDNLPDSPPRRGSNRPSLSPADCRTLEKILRDVVSPPATPSPLEQGDRLFPDSDRAGTTGAANEEDGYHFVGGEATDTGYEDEDDSMELSEGEETITDQVVTLLGEPASPSVSKSERRLQESVSVHDEKEKMRYSSDHRSSTTRRTKTKRPQQERTASRDVTAGDTIEDVMNLSGKRAPPARWLDLGQLDSDRQADPDDIKHLNSMRLSTEKVIKQERLNQEGVEGEEEPGVFVPTVPGPQDQAQDDEDSELDGFAADDEQTQPRFSLGISGASRRKISHGSASKSTDQYSPGATRNAAETPVRVPSTPTPILANQTPESAHIQSATNQVVPETPFTKTLSFFKQHKGAENSPPARHHDTALPQEIAEVAEDVAEVGAETNNMQHGIAHHEVELAATGTSALEVLQAMVQSNENTEAGGAALQQGDDCVQVHAVEGQGTDECDVTVVSAISDDQKQIILYPQNPAFINAIGMIPATMFWVTAAPVVKYTGIAVELLIDQLRDTFL